MPPTDKGLFHRKAFWALLAILILWIAYSVFSYWIPSLRLRWMPSMEPYAQCAPEDSDCVERGIEAVNEYWDVMAPVFRVVESKEFADALKHRDGTTCFLITDPSREASSEEMKTWLDGFGAKRFYEMAPFFLGLRYAFEEKYHPPSPADAMIKTAARLKWRRVPFGKAWRDYNFAQRFWELNADNESTQPDMPQSLRPEIFHQYLTDGYLFQNQNVLLLLSMSRPEMEGALHERP